MPKGNQENQPQKEVTKYTCEMRGEKRDINGYPLLEDVTGYGDTGEAAYSDAFSKLPAGYSVTIANTMEYVVKE